MLAADPVISEFTADNDGVWVDDRGDFSDFIELYNPDSQPLNLAGWALTDSPSNLQEWVFPAVTIPGRGYLLVSASGDDRRDPAEPLHTSFQLDADGEFLALVRPDGTVAQSFSPYAAQKENVSFGRSQKITTLLGSQASVKYHVPTAGDAGLESSWMNTNFADQQWTTGLMGIGFGMYDPGFTVRLIDVTGGTDGIVTTSVEAERIVAGTGGVGRYDLDVDVTTSVPVLDLGTGSGTFGADVPYAADTDGDNIIVNAKAIVTIPEGQWTIALGADDGGVLTLADPSLTFSNEQGVASDTPGDNVLRYNTQRGHDWMMGQITVGPGGITTELNAMMFSQTDENSMELAIFPGHTTGPVNRAQWQLLSDGTLGWRVARPASAEILTDVQASMLGVNSSLWARSEFQLPAGTSVDALRMNVRYDDGFVMYLNGQQVAQRLAPNTLHWNSTATAKRGLADAFDFELVDLTAYSNLLVPGRNVVAFQLLNSAVADPSAGLVAELTAVTDIGNYSFFQTMTPGTPNGDVQTEFTAAPTFNVDRGFFTDPFELTISTATPGATIRYTLNGAAPTASNSLVYTSPLTITGTTVLRAATFKDGAVTSNSETQTYLFLGDVILQSPLGKPPTGWPTGSVNGQRLDYGMDPDIVNSAVWGPQLTAALTQIPSFSITTDLANLFNTSTGIYVNPGNHGRAWERPASIELIDPTNLSEFQINGGIRIRGGFSRSGGNPKHAFRLFFRNDYGDGKLQFPLFGDEGTNEFENVDLRTTQNYSWSFGGDARNSFVRDIFSREVQGAMGDPYTKGRFYHLYLNGQYWGIYQTDERAEAAFAESYLGGDKSDYDVIKNGGNSNEATDGDLQAYRRLWQATNAGYASNEAYYKIQGMNPDGTRNLAYERLLDVDNLIDYMIITYFTADMDGPGSRFTQPRPNNFVGIYNRNNPDGFKWFEHDSEHSLDTGAGDMVNPLTINHPGFSSSNFTYFNPQWLHERLTDNLEYRTRFADRVQQALYGDGPLSTTQAAARIQGYANTINMAIVAESARWGDSVSSTPLTKTNWENAIRTIQNWIAARHPTVISQLSGRNWYPSITGAQVLVNGIPTSDARITAQDPISFGGTVDTNVTQLVPAKSLWAYLDTGIDPGAGWQNAGFNDLTWKTGKGEFGYGDGDETTTVSYGADAAQKYVTTYFRHLFFVKNAKAFDYVTLRLKRDDGAVVYLNGQEIARSNMPDGPITSTTFASGVVGGGDESAFTDISINKALLLTGDNQLAVEIHQSSRDSSDISFDLELVGGSSGGAVSGVYYTLDGSDPRAIGGAVGAAATLYDGVPLTIDQSRQINARVLADGKWSVMSIASLQIDPAPAAGDIVLSEIHYNPAAADKSIGEANLDAQEFEFIELTNVSQKNIDLTNATFTDGITFQFGLKTLRPNQRLVVIKNQTAFLSRYPGFDLESIGGIYTGNLSNAGERIRLVGADNTVLVDVTYDDSDGWPDRADGKGSSLELVNLQADPKDPASWDSSDQYHGTPGAAAVVYAPSILINEVLANSALPQVDAIELVNITDQPVNLTGWYLSDSSDAIKKYKFPETTIPAGGYLVLTEAQFNAGGGLLATEFALNSLGDDVWLVAANASGRLQQIVDRVDFGATLTGVSLGRLANASPQGDLFPLAQQSFGQPNGIHRAGELVVGELHYNPTGDDAGLEFVELTNTTANPLNVGLWHLRGGLNYDIPAGRSIPAGGSAVIVPFDPANAAARNAFVAAYPSAANATLWGPWLSGTALDNSGERISILRPDTPPPGVSETPYVLVDEVRYDDQAPWPTGADGTGQSLHRLALGLFGSSPGSWKAAAPSPGTSSSGLVGDASLDGQVNAQDLDLFAAAINGVTYEPRFDLIYDLRVDAKDRDYVVHEILHTTAGDVNLDQDVDSDDLLAFLAGWTGPQENGQGTNGWANGDGDGDRDTDSADLIILLENWTGPSAQPERAVDALFAQN
ncbi:MAG: lamin tail domain-containing protein [Pirellulales bacterium]